MRGLSLVAEAYETKGMYQEAAAKYRKIAEEERLSLFGKHRLIYLYVVMGRRDEAQKPFAETQKSLQEGKAKPQAMFSIALAHVALGQKDKAFEIKTTDLIARLGFFVSLVGEEQDTRTGRR